MTKKDEIKLKDATKQLENEGYKIVPEGYIHCGECDKDKSVKQNNFYISLSPIHTGFKTAMQKSKDGNIIKKEYCYAPICKSCLLKNIDYKNIATVLRALQIIDKPFIPSIWESTITKDTERVSSSIFGTYVKNLMLNYKELTFFDGEVVNIDTSNIKNKDADDKAPKKKAKMSKKNLEEAKVFWGNNRSQEIYEFLEGEMIKLQSNFQCNDYGMEMILKDICWLNYEIEEKRLKNEDVTKLIKSRQELMNDGNLKPIQASGANSSDQMSYGLFIEKLENERPVGEPDPIWADVDGLKKIVRVWFLGHMCHLMGIQNKLSKEYLDEYDEEIGKYTVEKEEVDIDNEEIGED